MYSTLVPLCTVKEMLYSRAHANSCSKLEATCDYYHINGIALTLKKFYVTLSILNHTV